MTTVLITGANRGIGLEFAKQFAGEGAEVIACCRNPSRAEALKEFVKEARNVRIEALDVADPKSVVSLKSDLKDTPIDILINNAGVSGPREQPSGIVDTAAFLDTFAVNSVAPVTMAVAFHDNLKKSREKKLVTITSQLGSIANHWGGASAYNASKAAVNSFMKGLSKSWASDGIAVGILHPGWVKTDMGGQGAPVTPEQSVTGLRQQIAALSVSNSGRFVDFTGKELPW